MTARAKRLVAFTLLGGFAAFSWYGLIAGYETSRWLASVGVAVAGGLALIAIGARVRPRPLAWLAALAVIAAMLVAGLATTGIEWRLLAPAGWAELRDLLQAGLSGVSQVDTPYAGNDAWTRIGMAAGAPLMLALAFGFAFWPTSKERGGYIAGMLLLAVLYGASVTWEAPPNELLRGAIFFVALAMVMWLPRVQWNSLAASGLAVVLAAAVGLGLASKVNASDPIVEYTSWRIFGDEERRTFDWDHTYGPIDWPQEGTELFRVETEGPAYWKTSVLDSFDGAVWKRVDAFGADPAEAELAGGTELMEARHPNWVNTTQVEILALSSDLAVAPGSRPAFADVDADFASADGTTTLGTELERGDTYAVESYVPDPSPRALRRNTSRFPAGLERYTTLLLPRDLFGLGGPEDALAYGTAIPGEHWSREPSEQAGLVASGMEDLVRGGPYERVYDLAMRLTRDEETVYSATANVKRFLIENYDYEQDVPNRRFPLSDFLFRDREGYCQQFSGAMAMMLRMSGIPARVVSGFAPGFREGNGTYLVRDTEAHSWVEVYFPKVGWVTVDPTPSAAPARTETFGTTGRGGGDLAVSGAGRAFSLEESVDPGGVGNVDGRELTDRSDDEGGGLSIAGLAVAIAGLGVAGVYWRRRRFLTSAESAGSQLREVERAVAELTPDARASTTLLSLQQWLSVNTGPDASRYVAGLGANRFAPGKPKRPGPDARRAFRAALARQAGARRWFRAMRLIPPGGPRR